VAKSTKAKAAPRAKSGRATATARGSAIQRERSQNGSKLAVLVADQMVRDIAALGWPEGTVIGSEPELLDRYGVSRAVFREAVRLVEHQQVARMRRGPGGGLVVTAAGVDSVTDAVAVYLYYVGAEIDEVFDARRALEEMAAELAPDRLDESDIASLRAVVQREQDGAFTDHRELHTQVAAITKNPALEFFVDLLSRATLLYLPQGSRVAPRTLGELAKAHAAIADAILASNGGLARHRMHKHLVAEAAFLRKRGPSRSRLAMLPAAVDRGNKRAEHTAREIFREVTDAGWPVGEPLGSEAELMERYGVSRAVLREAVGVLEHHQIARMRRGPGGGLIVAQPGIEAVTDAVALHVERRGIRPDQLFEVRTVVEMAVLDDVMLHLDEPGVATILAALDAERNASRAEFPVVGHDLHTVLAQVAGNRVLELLAAVLVRLTRIHNAPPSGVPDPLPSQDVVRVHRRIVEAVLARDIDLARHRMRKHLDALVKWVR
jgi:DNA-binding FadR family transcriptional regulator